MVIGYTSEENVNLLAVLFNLLLSCSCLQWQGNEALECDELNDMLALCLPGVLNIN
jgi:hypothetical protein